MVISLFFVVQVYFMDPSKHQGGSWGIVVGHTVQQYLVMWSDSSQSLLKRADAERAMDVADGALAIV
jgi:hypothetical protein